nr:hypothetical protein [uncultured Caldimonas sp.]
MSKVVQAVNAMISNPQLITNVMRNGKEFFFVYKGKYKWSVSKNEKGEYYLFFYPGDEELEHLARYENEEWEGTPMVTYSDGDIGTKEATASFAELYTLIKERVYGVNEVLDDIISDMDEL